MLYPAVKLMLSALIIVVASEFAKRSVLFGGLIVSLPIVSILTLIWVYRETGDPETIIKLSHSIAGFVIPSLVLFFMLPIFLKRGMPFYAAMALACIITIAAYLGSAFVFRKWGQMF